MINSWQLRRRRRCRNPKQRSFFFFFLLLLHRRRQNAAVVHIVLLRAGTYEKIVAHLACPYLLVICGSAFWTRTGGIPRLLNTEKPVCCWAQRQPTGCRAWRSWKQILLLTMSSCIKCVSFSTLMFFLLLRRLDFPRKFDCRWHQWFLSFFDCFSFLTVLEVYAVWLPCRCGNCWRRRQEMRSTKKWRVLWRR